MSCSSTRAASLALLIASGNAAAADPFENLRYAFSGGTPNLDVRARYENVSQDNALVDANAFTVRTRLGYTTGKWNLFDAQAEYEGTVDLSEDAYNSTLNGATTRAQVLDPQGDELNQAWLRYTGLPGTTVKLGRQRLIYDNARFIGNVGWRQNEQTYDAVAITNTSLPKTTFNYAYVGGVKNVTYAFVNAGGHLFNLKYAALDELAVTFYGYWLDFKINPAAPAPAAPNRNRDSRTLGLRATGTVTHFFGKDYPLNYSLEYALQDPHEDSPSSVDANYLLAEVGVKAGPVTPTLGYEKMSGDGSYGFQTPLATLHAFNGWADQFLNTPNTGLVRTYLKLSGSVMGLQLSGFYHQFKADTGGAKYGDEIDFLASYAVNDSLTGNFKLANYNADTFSVDTRKIWVYAEYKF